MKVFIDTNILISASLFPGGSLAKAYFKAIEFPNQGVISDQVINEMKRIFYKKFPNKMNVLNEFMATSMITLEIVATPSEPINEEPNVRDVMDRPILRAAMHSNADILLTGDKDLLEADVKGIKIMNASKFMGKY